ncbi:MAG: acyl-CoA synthetase [Acidimicrobiales bacterium]
MPDPALLAGGTLPRAWAQRWSEAPDAPVARVVDGPWVNAADLDALSRRAAARFQAAGLRAGDRVLISAASSVALIAHHVGALRLGLVVVPVNTAYGEAELGHITRDAEPSAAVLDDERRVPWVGDVPVLMVADDLHQLEAAATGALDRPDPGDPALIGYTSGTTGRPKGAVLSHANLLASAEALRVAWRWSPTDRLILALPLFHMHGLGVGVHGTLLAGASMVLLPRFDVDAVLDAVPDATLFFGVPTMYARLAASDRVGELAGLRLCVSGSAPLPPEVFERIAIAGHQRVLERYGMTETVMLLSNPYEGERRAGSVGFPLPGVELTLDEGDAGEILVRGPSVFGGYWRNDDATRAAFRDGWFLTGDVGERDCDGYIRIVGRNKELIISGGFNVYPREVEEVLETHPAVLEAAVTGTPDPEWGEAVTAYVVLRHPVSTKDLVEHCKGRLAPFKSPRLVHVVEALPRNALGKIQRDALSPPTD